MWKVLRWLYRGDQPGLAHSFRIDDSIIDAWSKGGEGTHLPDDSLGVEQTYDILYEMIFCLTLRHCLPCYQYLLARVQLVHVSGISP